MLCFMKEEKYTYAVGLKGEQNEEGFKDKCDVDYHSFSQQTLLANLSCAR